MNVTGNVFICNNYCRQVMFGAAISSARFADELLASIDFASARLIVVYDVHDCAVPVEILRRMHSHAKLLLITSSIDLINALKSDCDDERLNVYHPSAVEEALRDHDHPDYIISAIPFSMMPPAITTKSTQVLNSILIISEVT